MKKYNFKNYVRIEKEGSGELAIDGIHQSVINHLCDLEYSDKKIGDIITHSGHSFVFHSILKNKLKKPIITLKLKQE